MKDYLFSPVGRINRAKYWLAVLIFIGASFAVSAIFTALWAVIPGEVVDGEYTVNGLRAIPYIVVGIGAVVFFVWAGICLGIKRCHDRGRSGFFMLVQLIPLIGGIWYFVEAYCLRGTVGPNQYGPDPLDPGAPAA